MAPRRTLSEYDEEKKYERERDKRLDADRKRIIVAIESLAAAATGLASAQREALSTIMDVFKQAKKRGLI